MGGDPPPASGESPPAPARLSNDTHRSSTDPDARLLAKPFAKTQLAYSENLLMDNAHRVIVEVEVSEPNIHIEGQVAGQMVERSRLRLGLKAETVGGDKAYGYGAAVRALCEAGVEPPAPAPVQGQWNAQGIFGKDDFVYDRERDELICRAGKRLHKRTEHARNRQTEYAARVADCRACPLKAQCTRARYRVAHRHWDQDYLARAARGAQHCGVSSQPTLPQKDRATLCRSQRTNGPEKSAATRLGPCHRAMPDDGAGAEHQADRGGRQPTAPSRRCGGGGDVFWAASIPAHVSRAAGRARGATRATRRCRTSLLNKLNQRPLHKFHCPRTTSFSTPSRDLTLIAVGTSGNSFGRKLPTR